MKGSLRSLEVTFVILLILASLGGCASSRTQGMVQSQEYRRVLERQKAEMSLEQAAVQKLPEMTAEEFERVGDRYLAQGNMDMAFIQYKRALNLDPKQIRLRHKVGYLFLEREMWQEAQAECQDIVRSNPTYTGPAQGTAHLPRGSATCSP